MRARRLLVVIAFVGTGAAGGCLLTSDFDGVAGVRPTEGGTGDETGGSNEGGPVDGSAAADADAAGTSPCSTGKHVVCSDFDNSNGALPVPGWNNSEADGGALSLDKTTSSTAPFSLNAKVKGTASPSAYLFRQPFLGTFKALEVSFDMRIVACPAQGSSVTAVFIEPSATAAFGFVFLSSGVQAIGVSVNGTLTSFPLERQVLVEKWTHLVYRIIVKDASTSHLNLTVDGMPSVDTDAPSGAMKTTALLNIGLLGSSIPKGCEVQFDNYVLDQE